jgi:anaerobic selenocysteine-containing dehydrogenase
MRSTCELCNEGCGVLVHMSHGKPVGVEGDPENPINRGAICEKGRASIDILNSPDRLKYPLERKGDRGEGKWHQISWDEALTRIAGELNRIKERYGPESVVFIRGGAKGYQDSYMGRFANVFGSPNIASMAPVCYMPRHHASVLTYGYMACPDYEYTPACLVIWGVNPVHTSIGEAQRANNAIRNGSKLIVIDPMDTEFAKRADLWVKPRPATDLALALAMINVIISEGSYDRDFVGNWTVGFEELAAHVKDYTPEKVEQITWIPAETIRTLGRLYAGSTPASIAWGNGIDNNRNNFQSSRAIAILRSITGNIGAPGGDVQWSPSGIVPKGNPDLNQQDALPPKIRDRRLSRNSGLLPINYYALPQDIVKAILTDEPYPVRALFVHGASLLHTYSNAKETYQALEGLDFMVAANLFMTPTTEMADIVLPLATYLEIDNLHESEFMSVVSAIQKVADVSECWSDYRIYNELSKRMELGNYFFKNENALLDYLLKPVGITFDELKKLGFISGQKQYRNYERNGFNTASGKVELYSNALKEWGFDPLPTYYESVESVISDLQPAEESPLILTNRKIAHFHHSAGREIKRLRNKNPEPVVHINTETAKRLDIKEGDWVHIETTRGKIRQKVCLNKNIHHSVIIADYGWWFPEKSVSENLHGWAESNLNILTDNKEPFAREMGSATLRGIECKVYKCHDS